MEPAVSVIMAIISACSAIVVSIINNIAQMSKIRDEQRETFNKFSAETGKAMALTDERIKILTEEVKKHNSVIERVYKCETRETLLEKDIEDLKRDIKEV